ncbi:8-amino-7-oxononanoate synthase [Desulfonauticus submarinus]|uniref:8-amino-7-oxononanoate synthase n=1 Tax=Desulfonauticus submarinus TaxID=206665 RepID=A0A1H0DM54_9BACT|nr:8-amino-7-oxononanoate synthase [Desulfonauticus submarinus]SDN71139.1 8-amino-7-oxononanoate synthase [Desulfonauticus submarinus]
MKFSWNEHIKTLLKKQKKANLFRTCLTFINGADLYLTFKTKKVLNLASNNYLGLANNPSLIKETITLLQKYGIGAGASPLISGHSELTFNLENTLAKFKHTEACLVFSSGYTTNIGIFSALADKNTLVFSDKLNHASIIDGILLSQAKLIRYKHLDIEHLDYLLKKYTAYPKKILVTDSIFSMDGDIAPLNDLVYLKKKYNFLFIIDEAHATGIFGQGRGLAHEFKVQKEIDIQMGTFSKALGTQGGYVCANKNIISLLINKARSFIFSTAISPVIAGSTLAAINFIKKHPNNSKKLLTLAKDIKDYLNNLNFDTGNSCSQIIPIILKDPVLTLKAKDFLLEQDIFIPAIRPPAVPPNTSRLRISLRADLQDQDILKIKQSFKNLKEFLAKC